MLRIFIITIFLIMQFSCITSEELQQGQNIAYESTKKFQSLYNEKKFSEIESFLHPDLIKRVSVEGFRNRLETTYQEKGKVISVYKKVSSVKGYKKTDIVASVSLHTTYEKGELDELFVWKIENDQVYLINYLIETELKLW